MTITLTQRIMATKPVRVGLAFATVWFGCRWWFHDDTWIAPLLFGIALASAEHARQAVTEDEDFDRMPHEARDNEPSLAVRFFGHPVLAVPVIVSTGVVSAVLLIFEQRTHGTIDGNLWIGLGLYCVPAALSLMALIKRTAWKRANEPKPEPEVVTAAAPAWPEARPATPHINGIAVTVAGAMNHLPPNLLELVADGFSRQRPER